MAEEGSKHQALNGWEQEGWSTRVEDVLDGGDENGAVQLPEKVVHNLQIRSDAGSNLALAAALNDLGQIYASQGLSLKSDQLLTSALLIKQKREQQPVEFRDGALGERNRNGAQNASGVVAAGSASSTKYSNEFCQLRSSEHLTGKASTAGEREEGDWEAILDEVPAPRKSPSEARVQSIETSASKQRGRGTFTYGGFGMYSDNYDGSAGDDGEVNNSQMGHFVDETGASHVLVLTFSQKTKTRDLEELVKPFASKGSCSIRWVDDTRALAVFSSPSMARDALVGIKDTRFKVSMSFESSEVFGDRPSVKDLTPPGPRPASSARVAQRMIASALSSPGVSSQALHAKTRGSIQEAQKQEKQRKERLQSRAQLRDEAWGSDGDK